MRLPTEAQMFDVLFGRGSGVFGHPGNKLLRDIVIPKMPEYQSLRSQSDKTAFLNEIIATFRGDPVVVSFWIKPKNSNEWRHATDDEIRSKIRHLLRDKKDRKMHSRYRRHPQLPPTPAQAPAEVPILMPEVASNTVPGWPARQQPLVIAQVREDAQRLVQPSAPAAFLDEPAQGQQGKRPAVAVDPSNPQIDSNAIHMWPLNRAETSVHHEDHAQLNGDYLERMPAQPKAENYQIAVSLQGASLGNSNTTTPITPKNGEDRGNTYNGIPMTHATKGVDAVDPSLGNHALSIPKPSTDLVRASSLRLSAEDAAFIDAINEASKESEDLDIDQLLEELWLHGDVDKQIFNNKSSQREQISADVGSLWDHTLVADNDPIPLRFLDSDSQENRVSNGPPGSDAAADDEETGRLFRSVSYGSFSVLED